MVTQLSRMLVQGRIDENCTVFIDAAKEGAKSSTDVEVDEEGLLTYRVEKTGGVAAEAAQRLGNFLIEPAGGWKNKKQKTGGGGGSAMDADDLPDDDMID